MVDRVKEIEAVGVDSAQARKIIDFLTEHHTVLDDTVVLSELEQQGIGESASAFEPGVPNVAPELQEQFSSGVASPERATIARAQFKKTVDILGALHRAGIIFVAGTDQAVPGYSLYRNWRSTSSAVLLRLKRCKPLLSCPHAS